MPAIPAGATHSAPNTGARAFAQPMPRQHLHESTTPMAGYKEPSFQDRVTAAAKARDKALAKLQAKAPLDPAIVAERAAKAAAREAALAEKSAAAKADREAKAAARAAEAAARAAEAEAKALAENVPELTEAEKKALRDAKYAARKARKR